VVIATTPSINGGGSPVDLLSSTMRRLASVFPGTLPP
jgi:hypothetical protein